MSLTETQKQAPEFDEVIFFTEKNFAGTGYLAKLDSRIDIWRQYLALNDKLMSVKLGRSCNLVAYRHGGFGAPSKSLGTDSSDIDIGGLSAFIVTGKTGEHPVTFTFHDEMNEHRSMTLKSSEFPEGGEHGVVQPNPSPMPGVDPNTPRVFAILKDSNHQDRPLVVAIYVRRASGEYEDMGAAMNVYWEGGKVHVKEVPGYGHPNLHHVQDGANIQFVWR